MCVCVCEREYIIHIPILQTKLRGNQKNVAVAFKTLHTSLKLCVVYRLACRFFLVALIGVLLLVMQRLQRKRSFQVHINRIIQMIAQTIKIAIAR